MTAASFKFRYAGAAFLVVLVIAAAIAALFLVRHAGDTRDFDALAQRVAHESFDPELQARAKSIAAHAADSIAAPLRARDLGAVARRLQPFIDDPTVAALRSPTRRGQRSSDGGARAAPPAGR